MSPNRVSGDRSRTCDAPRRLRTRLAVAAACFCAAAFPAAAAGGPRVVVDATADIHPISGDIYGMNFAPEALARELGLPVRRWCGNSTTRYNWQIDVLNTGSVAAHGTAATGGVAFYALDNELEL